MSKCVGFRHQATPGPTLLAPPCCGHQHVQKLYVDTPNIPTIVIKFQIAALSQGTSTVSIFNQVT